MKYISLFAGIGGIDLGLDRAGMECVAQVEKNDFCLKVLTKHWAHVPKFKDVKDVGKNNLPAADLICGGFPCQPHSLAGKRKASADDRDLWGEFARIIRECRPKWVLAENVPGLLSSENGRFFGRVLRDLGASGYDVEWQSISAAAFGAPHIRERVYIVAHHKSEGERAISVFSRRPQQEGNDADGLREDVSDSNGRQAGYKSKDKIGENFGSGSGKDSWHKGLQREVAQSQWWQSEPELGRVAHGIPNRVDRLMGLGNAVVPQAIEFIGNCINRAEACLDDGKLVKT